MLRADRVYELETLTEPELLGLIDRGVTTVVVPFGSIEPHGGHLPLGADALLADAVGQEVAKRLDAVLGPTVRIGYAERHGRVLTVQPETLTDLALDVAESLASQGFRLIALISTHGGNAGPLRDAVDRINQMLGRAVACAPIGDVGPRPGSYSGEWLTSVLMAIRPELVHTRAANSELTEELREASPERGAQHLERFVRAIVDGVNPAAG